MEDSAALRDLLGRAHYLFYQAGQLGRGCMQMRQSRLPIDETLWSRFAMGFEGFFKSVLELRDSIENPPPGADEVVSQLREAARIAKAVRDVIQTDEGRARGAYLDIYPDLNSVAETGGRAISKLAEERRMAQYAALDEIATDLSSPDASAPTLPKPPAQDTSETASRLLTDLQAAAFQAATLRQHERAKSPILGSGPRNGQRQDADKTAAHIPLPAASADFEADEQGAGEWRQFLGGQMVFFDDRVELCGVDICSGRRSKTKRKILDLLREKQSNGFFVAYSSEQMAAKVGIKGGRSTIIGAIRGLRRDICERLRRQVNIACGLKDVIIHGSSGYHLYKKLSVQVDRRFAGTPRTDFAGKSNVRNVRDQDVGDVRDDDVRDVRDPPRGFGAQRRAWILEQLAAGHRIRAHNVKEQFNCSTKTAERDLQTLKDEARIEFVGSARAGLLPPRPRHHSQGLVTLKALEAGLPQWFRASGTTSPGRSQLSSVQTKASRPDF